jgi:molybdate transport system substrate-binding protein
MRFRFNNYLIIGLFWLLTACVAPPVSPVLVDAEGTDAAADVPSILLTVAAASDLQFAFTEIAERFQEQTGHSVTLVFGSTGQLAQQIENGAPYDVFAAANVGFVERLNEQNLVLPDTIEIYARGRIVLAVNQRSSVEAVALEDLLSHEIRHVAIANPSHAPYGLAAMQALESAGLWEALQPKLVLGENVRQALQYVQTGDAETAIIALSIAEVPEITWTLIDEALHEPLDQALAVVSSTQQEEVARTFAAFVNSEEGRAIKRNYGFMRPGEDSSLPQTRQP